ncbi:MAG: preprotein translocase subunit YajC [Oscillospiraceae bacterium]|nr:preprotein translocase subunit YajC [Oscillospiraceae bacterium]
MSSASANPGGLLGNSTMIIVLALFIGVFYFMIIRPENKKKKEQEALRNSIHKGDKITTIGGIMGKVVDVKDEKIVIETGEDQVRMELQKWSVMSNSTAEAEKGKRAAEAREAAAKAKEEKAKAKAAKKADKDLR